MTSFSSLAFGPTGLLKPAGCWLKPQTAAKMQVPAHPFLTGTSVLHQWNRSRTDFGLCSSTVEVFLILLPPQDLRISEFGGLNQQNPPVKCVFEQASRVLSLSPEAPKTDGL